jgi:hypothetical protein
MYINFFKKTLRYLKALLNNIFLDFNEKNFIKNKNLRKFDVKKKNILIELSLDYYYLCYYKLLISDKKLSTYNIIGLWPYSQSFTRKRFFLLETIQKLYYFVLLYLKKRKIKKLYSAIGVCNFFNAYKFKLFFNNKKSFAQINVRKDLIKFKIDKIQVGDLIYDTYVRFRGVPTVILQDNFLHQLINKSFNIINNLKNLNQRFKFKYFFTSYTTYIHHGLPTRFFLQKRTPVFSGTNSNQYNKRLSINNSSHDVSYSKYLNIFKSFSNKEKRIKQNTTFNLLSKRFSGNPKYQLNYLRKNPYKNQILNQSQNKILNKVKGVLFLHEFFDSPWDRRKIIFWDYYLWTVYSLILIQKYNLPIAVKPHLSSDVLFSDSYILIQKLKKKFPNINWLKSDCSNKIIFKKINFGVSVSGSVLFELAYHNIKAVACGTHPGVDFNFTINAYNKKDYKATLLNIKNIKKPNYSKKNLLSFYYMYQLYQKDDLPNFARTINLKNIDFSNSNGLNKFDKILKNINKIVK